jgi:hypothetical protein
MPSLPDALGGLLRADARRRGRAAAAGELRQRLERSARAAAMIDQGAEGAGADVVAADQPQPVQALLIGQADACLK